MKYHTEYQEDQDSANAHVNATDLEASAAFATTIFDVIAAPTRCPSHESVSVKRQDHNEKTRRRFDGAADRGDGYRKLFTSGFHRS